MITKICKRHGELSIDNIANVKIKEKIYKICKICRGINEKRYKKNNLDKIKLMRKKSNKLYNMKNKEYMKERNKIYKNENKIKIRAINIKYQKTPEYKKSKIKSLEKSKQNRLKKMREYFLKNKNNLTDIYCKQLLRNQGFDTRDITNELIELKRHIVILKKEIKTQKS